MFPDRNDTQQLNGTNSTNSTAKVKPPIKNFCNLKCQGANCTIPVNNETKQDDEKMINTTLHLHTHHETVKTIIVQNNPPINSA